MPLSYEINQAFAKQLHTLTSDVLIDFSGFDHCFGLAIYSDENSFFAFVVYSRKLDRLIEAFLTANDVKSFSKTRLFNKQDWPLPIHIQAAVSNVRFELENFYVISPNSLKNYFLCE